MEQWEIDLLAEHLAHWFSGEELEEIYESDRPATAVAAELATYDFAFFCRYYLPHFFVQPPAECHWPVFADIQWALTNGRSTTLAESLPRGFGKSSIIAVACPMWAIIGEDDPSVKGKDRTPLKHYILIIKDSWEQAKLELQSIRHELETNEKLIRDFGDLVGRPWGKSEITTANNAKIDVLGTGQKLRGRRHKQYRPDLIVADDLENDETVLSPTQRRKVKTWYARAVEKAGDPQTCTFICLGTLIHYDCFQAWIMERPGVRARKYKALLKHADNQDLWTEWENRQLDLHDENREVTAERFYRANREDMLDGSIVAWEDRFPYYTLRLMQLGEKQHIHGKKVHAFSAEMQNEPISDEERLFRTIRYWHWENRKGIAHLVPDDAGRAVPIRTCRLWGAVDPSLGEGHTGAFSAIIEILVSRDNLMFVVHAHIERMHPDRIIDYIEQRLRFWSQQRMAFSGFAVEVNQFQKLFASKLGQELLRTGFRLPIQQVHSQAHKTARIDSLQPDLTNGYILLHKEQSAIVPQEQYRLWEQLYSYPMGDFVDGPDALEMARTLVASGLGSRIPAAEILTTSDPFRSVPMAIGADPFS
jgi:predicted phage terminase large subunit-like protein